MDTHRKAVGFYWTLPVPWAGFTHVSEDVDTAATQSRTIRYQRDLVRQWAAEEHLQLVHEQVFVEISPDRGSDVIGPALDQAAGICRRHHAILLLVDFQAVANWRSHPFLADWRERAGIEIRSIFPDPVEIDGEAFDPHAHFRDWREAQENWSDGKAQRVARARARAGELRATGAAYKAIADTLNTEGLPTPTAKQWTADNVRKLLAAAPST